MFATRNKIIRMAQVTIHTKQTLYTQPQDTALAIGGNKQVSYVTEHPL
jgi:hypothetical protein